jgi:spore germination protein KA/spore germination protein
VKGNRTVREKEFDKLIEALRADGRDFAERIIPYRGGTVNIYFISQLTDRDYLAGNVIKPLMLYCSSAQEPVGARSTADRLIYADNLMIRTDFEQADKHILSGLTVLLFSTDREYLAVNCKAVEHRAVPTPELSFTLRGALDCFTENLNSNLSLLRYRMQDRNLRIHYFSVGRRTATKVAVAYVEDIAGETLVNRIKNRIQSIDVDGIGTTGELQSLLLDRPYRLFPQMGVIERSDMAYSTLLDGKVLVLADGSKDVIYAPKTFSEFFFSSDDRNDNKAFGFFARMLRYLALVISLTATSLYVAVTSYHTDVLPSDYAILLATLRSNTPFNAMIGSLLLEMTMELLREALLRVPRQIGPAIGIVGAIVIGQAAIAAGIFSSLLLILSAVSLLASFAMPDYTLIAPFRILKFFMIFATGFFGFFGFTVAMMAILTLLVSNTSFGVPFMTPFAPYRRGDFSKALADQSHISKWRPGYLENKDKKRMR